MLMKLTIGGLQIEYEGDEKFFKDEVAAFVSAVSAYATIEKKAGTAAATAETDTTKRLEGQGNPLPPHSTDTVAKLLSVKTGPDLIVAAVAKKILVDGQPTVDRSSITDEMKKATSYYKRTYTSNLSNYLEGLLKADHLRLVSENVYGLPAKMRETLLPKLYE